MRGRVSAVLALVAMGVGPRHVEGGEMRLRKEVDLTGQWRLEIGDESRWAERKYDDSEWERIRVPSTWENQGFPGYDGYAWYRTRFHMPKSSEGREIVLKLGRVDDVDVTYVNGCLVGGKGGFPPEYETAWDQKRVYELPTECLRYGRENTLAVRVYDAHGGGGIYRGPVGVYSRVDRVRFEIDLAGQWRFSTGDDSLWSTVDYDASQWRTVRVPAFWEKQGFHDYDGPAWYRKTVEIPRGSRDEKLVLMLGKIDDFDRVYFNGTYVGGMGPGTGCKGQKCKDCYARRRAYFLPPELIRPGKENTIAVRVVDHGGPGGIYKGPVGIVSREEYLRFSRGRK